MSGAPFLSRNDITEQLDKLYRDGGTHRRLVAFFGTGAEEAANTTHAGQFMVVPVRSELELRERLPDLSEPDARMAFLVPWTQELPLDIAGRFARNGRVLRIGLETRLLSLLGASEVADDARGSALAAYLLAQASPPALKVPAGRVTGASLWNAWLAAAWGIDVSGGLALDNLLAWAATDQRGPEMVKELTAPTAKGVRDGLVEHLRAQLGEPGVLVLRAWLAGRGRSALAHALVLETLAQDPHQGVQTWIKLALKTALDGDPQKDLVAAGKALGQAAESALRMVERKAPSLGRQIAREADGLADLPELREALAPSRLLPAGWTARLDALGRALEAASVAPSAESVAGAVSAFRALEGHTSFSELDRVRAIAADMAVRLAAWLAARPELQRTGAPTPYADAEILGRWYAEEGGFVDWARRAARGPANDPLGKGIQAVVAAADTARDALDRRFAKALAAWVEAGRPAQQVIPIDQAVKRTAVQFLEEDPERRVLVLLLDGMAWAQAVEILQSLGERPVPWGPLAWHAAKKGRIGQGAYPVVFANLPTLTEVSRAAFFAGKELGPGRPVPTSKDVERWAAHRDVAKLVPQGETAKLLLRGEGHTQDGAPSAEALSLVGDRNRRIVAIVINAIDASLKSDPQHRHEWMVDSIRSLPLLLERAREAGRAVLLASDHGHVPGDRLTSIGAIDKGGARWRPWASETEVLGPSELGFRGSTVSSPPGAHGVVLLTDEASRYGGGPHAGEHGGATLAEVVAPCLLIGSEDLATPTAADRALEVVACHVPRWWHFDVGAPVVVEAAPIAEPPARPRKPAPENQLTLGIVASAPAVSATPAVAPLSGFGRSAVLAALVKSPADRKQIIEAVELLLARQGMASEAAFAAAMNVPPYRVSGLVAKIQEVLNLDGFQVLRFDGAAKTIVLDREKLAQQFEVEL